MLSLFWATIRWHWLTLFSTLESIMVGLMCSLEHVQLYLLLVKNVQFGVCTNTDISILQRCVFARSFDV